MKCLPIGREQSSTLQEGSPRQQRSPRAPNNTGPPSALTTRSRGLLPRSVMMQPRIATRAPVLRPVAVEATAPQDRATLSESQSHTRTDSVLVLLRAGLPLSTISTGSRYTSCSRRRKPPRLVSTDAVLSAEWRGGRTI